MTVRITGTGSALPARKVTNQDLTELVETSDDWIHERTGICERRIATQETVTDLAASACREALKNADKIPEEIDLILVATCSPELALPCVACQVQAALGAKKAAAFDLNAACSGFLFAFNTAYAYIHSGIYQTALVVGAEVLSKMVDWSDRSTCVLFGDGAGAAIVEKCEQEVGLLGFTQSSDGFRGDVLSAGMGFGSSPFFEKEVSDTFIKMNGQEVYRFATRQVPDCIQSALLKCEMKVEDIDLFILHQANIRIIEAVAKRLKADISRFPANLQRVGNMSSATIPVLLDELNRQGKLHRGMKIVLSGFGAGLTYGACVMIW